MRAYRYLLLAAGAVAGLLGCGGGSSTNGDVAAAGGQIFPVASGITMAEYAENGSVLQFSTPTDSEGRFEFRQALTGLRVVSVAAADERRVPDEWSALVTDASGVEPTPLSALQEQFVRFGSTPAAARAALGRTIGTTCGADAGLQADAALAPNFVATRSADWTLRALAAYVRALKDLGIAPGPMWPDELEQLAPLLTRMCALARQMDRSDWTAALAARVPELAGLEARSGMTYGPRLQARAADEVLRLVGGSAAVLQYTELQAILEPRLATWRGHEFEISLDLAEQMGHALVALHAAGAATPSSTAVAASLQALSLTPSGAVAQAIDGTVDTAVEANPVWRVANASAANRKVLLSVNGTPMFDRLALLDGLLRMPSMSPGEPLHRKAWRFVKRWTGGAVPITGGRFQHQADLYLRSIGAGRCDDDASALRELWSWLGYEARVWGLGGHIVPEVFVNGRWEMYDAHYGVYFLTRSGAVAGVDDLQRDPELVFAPVEVLDETFPRDVAEISQLYGDPDGNVVISWYGQDPVQPLGNELSVPAGGYVEVVGGASYAFPSLRWSDPNASVRTSQVKLWIPPGYSGAPIDLPLILADATGSGTLTALGQDFTVTADGIRSRLQDYYETDPDVGVTQVSVSNVGPEGLTLTLLLNASYFPAQQRYTIAVTAADTRDLKLVAPKPSTAR